MYVLFPPPPGRVMHGMFNMYPERNAMPEWASTID